MARLHLIKSPTLRTEIKSGEKQQAQRELREFLGWLFGRWWMNALILVAGLALFGNGVQTAIVCGTDESDFILGGLVIIAYVLARPFIKHIRAQRLRVGDCQIIGGHNGWN